MDRPAPSSLSFDAALRPSRRVRSAIVLIHLLGFAGIAFGAVALSSSIGAPLAGALALAAAIPVAWSGLRAIRRDGAAGDAGRGVLRVDASGRASLLRAGCAPARFSPRHWFAGVGIVWIDAGAGHQRVRVLLGRDALAQADWIRLHRWLRWLDRGGHAEG